jgi:N-acetylgalactosamine-6-sulfatase
MILADDLGWGDLSLIGAGDIATPRIDSLARSGVRFTQSYSNAPECSPTRCALLTGRYQQRVGGLECAIGVGDTGRYDEAAWLQSRGELGLPAEEAVLAPLLARAGYETALFGKWHLGYREKFLPTRQGFKEFFGILGGAADYYTHEEPNEGRGQKPLLQGERRVERTGNLTDLFAEAALEWLRKPRQRPFFLYLPFTAPHDPLQNPAEFDPATGTAPQRPKDRKTYAAMVAHLDRRVGDVLDQLERMGAAGNTLVVFHSDNGGTGAVGRNAPWRGSKSSVFEGGIRSPILMRWPARLKAGATCAQPAMTMDITATLLAAAGIQAASPRLDGVDLLPFAAGQAPSAERTMFWRYKRAANRRKAVRAGRWKYVFDSGAEFLFDLDADPSESRNLLTANPSRLAELKSKLTSWEVETAAPRLREFRGE